MKKKWRLFLKGEEKGKAGGNRLQTLEGTRERDGLRGASAGLEGDNMAMGLWRDCSGRIIPETSVAPASPDYHLSSAAIGLKMSGLWVSETQNQCLLGNCAQTGPQD